MSAHYTRNMTRQEKNLLKHTCIAAAKLLNILNEIHKYQSTKQNKRIKRKKIQMQCVSKKTLM